MWKRKTAKDYICLKKIIAPIPPIEAWSTFHSVQYLGHTFGTSPVPLGDLWHGWDQAVSVECVVTSVAQQHVLLSVATVTHVTDVQVHL